MLSRIRKIQLHNFQGHKDTEVTPAQGVTAIAGESTNGKTAVLRACNWLIFNRPSGIGFVSNWIKKDKKIIGNEICSVLMEVECDDGSIHTIERRRGAKENSYILDGLVLEAINTDVPEQVSSLLGMSDINVQNQHDAYFLLSSTGGQVAAKLNALVHLDAADEAFKYCKKEKGAKAAEARQLEDSISKTRKELQALPDITGVKKKIDRAKNLCTEVDELKQDLFDLDNTMRRMGLMRPDFSKIIKESVLDEMKALINKRTQACAGVASIAGMVTELSNLKGRLGGLSRASDEDIKCLERHRNLYNKRKEAYTSCADILDKWKELLEALKRNEKERALISSRLPDICPLCGGIINKEGEHTHAGI